MTIKIPEKLKPPKHALSLRKHKSVGDETSELRTNVVGKKSSKIHPTVD